ncbi:MAG: efflux RND transporter periplasmic adaptor subunit [Porticoccaceae bacterium]|nr:MAG: efflux RND transporter periplasmic adaptor subunit [Porticoccaceae bacterium]
MLTTLRRRDIALLVAVLVLTACDSRKSGAPAANPPLAIRATAVTAAQPLVQDVAVTERSVGLLESLIAPEVAAEVEGRYLRGFAKTGERVREGQLLAELDPGDYHIAAAAASAELRQLSALRDNQQRTVERYRALLAGHQISVDRHDEAVAQLRALNEQTEAARARLEQSERALTKTRVLSRYNGQVDAELASPGDFVKVGDPLFRITTTNRLRARLPLPETLASKLSVGQDLELYSPLTPDIRVASTISEIRPTIGVRNRAIDVFAIVDNPGGWQPGGSVNANIVIARRPGALLVPEAAVVPRPAGNVVYVVEAGAAHPRTVETGIFRDGLVEIRSGVTATDMVVVTGAAFLTEGTPVTVAPAGKTARTD